MTYVSTAEISPEMFVTVLLFLLVIAPLFSLAIMRFFKARKSRLHSHRLRRGSLRRIPDHHESVFSK